MQTRTQHHHNNNIHAPTPTPTPTPPTPTPTHNHNTEQNQPPDFGLAIDAAIERPVTRLGTLDYMAPEVLACPDKHAPSDNKVRRCRGD